MSVFLFRVTYLNVSRETFENVRYINENCSEQ